VGRWWGKTLLVDARTLGDVPDPKASWVFLRGAQRNLSTPRYRATWNLSPSWGWSGTLRNSSQKHERRGGAEQKGKNFLFVSMSAKVQKKKKGSGRLFEPARQEAKYEPVGSAINA